MTPDPPTLFSPVLNRSHGKLASQQRKSLEIANSEILRLNRMLSDLLDLSRADNQQLSIRREPFGLIPNLEQSLKLAQAAYGNPISNNLEAVPFLEVRGGFGSALPVCSEI